MNDMDDMIDFEARNHGTIWLIEPRSDRAKEHADLVYEDAQWFGRSVVCEHRYAVTNMTNLLKEGFRVSVGGEEIELRE